MCILLNVDSCWNSVVATQKGEETINRKGYRRHGSIFRSCQLTYPPLLAPTSNNNPPKSLLYWRVCACTLPLLLLYFITINLFKIAHLRHYSCHFLNYHNLAFNFCTIISGTPRWMLDTNYEIANTDFPNGNFGVKSKITRIICTISR